MKLIHFALAASAIAVAAPASAATFTFSYTPTTVFFGNGSSAAGTFTTSDTATTVGGREAFAITSISGIANGSNIAAPTGFYGNYFTDGTFLDGSGIRFFTEAGSDIRFFFQDTISSYRVNIFGTSGGSFLVNAVSAPAAAVPEAGTWALMIAGIGGAGGALRVRRRRTVSVAG